MAAKKTQYSQRNYLRIRGEERRINACTPTVLELPPHTRRRVVVEYTKNFFDRTTSAYAEKRSTYSCTKSNGGNYLRIRGEEHCHDIISSDKWELPPHTRRRVNAIFHPFPLIGTTSAYAEKSKQSVIRITSCGNYLRIRGEELVHQFTTAVQLELPPHTRRRDHCFPSGVSKTGTTSAYAEKRSATRRGL